MSPTKTILASTVLCLLPVGAARSAAEPVSRLHHARSLRCNFTAVAMTQWKDGRRAITNESVHEASITYDSIDPRKGMGRIIGNLGAGDVSVRYDAFGALWILETTPAGLLNVSTVFPMYAEGTDAFIIIEDRHSAVGTSILAEQSSGTCTILE